MKSTFSKSCYGLLAEHTKVQELLLKESKQMDDLLHPFMMNQATPHLGASSDLINNESRDRRK